MGLDKKADSHFFRSFDALHFAHCALAVDAARRKTPDVLASDAETGLEVAHPLIDNLKKDSAKSLEIHLHLLRFQQSEVLLCLMASNLLPGSFARFIEEYKYERLNGLMAEIAARVIPKGLELSRNGSQLDFPAWVEVKLFGEPAVSVSDPVLLDDLVNYISDEAQICRKRSVVNAFKHGCRISHGASALSLLDAETNKPTTVLQIDRGVAWSKWTNKKGQIKLEIGTQEFDPEVDLRRIVYGAILLKGICALRLARAENRKGDVDIMLPTPIGRPKPLQSTVVTIRANEAGARIASQIP